MRFHQSNIVCPVKIALVDQVVIACDNVVHVVERISCFDLGGSQMLGACAIGGLHGLGGGKDFAAASLPARYM